MANEPASTPPIPANLNAREQAALALRLPNSGTPWLDMMIMQAYRRDLTMQMFQAFCAQKVTETDVAVVKKAGLDAWLKINGADMSEALSLCEALAKTAKPPAKPAAAPVAEAARTSGPLSLA